jgi:hypothetical protein
MAQLRVGDLVIRSHRLLKTHGTIVRVASQRRGKARQVWVKWDHPDTLPNPSLEAAETLELVERPDEPPTASVRTHRYRALSASGSISKALLWRLDLREHLL